MERFVQQLAKLASDDSALLTRKYDGHSDRGFRLTKDGQSVDFFAKISQSETGFWGLGIERAKEMLKNREPLILLTSEDEGFFIVAARLEKLIPTFSTAEKGHDYKIGEGRVRREWRFRSLEELLEKLKERLV